MKFSRFTKCFFVVSALTWSMIIAVTFSMLDEASDGKTYKSMSSADYAIFGATPVLVTAVLGVSLLKDLTGYMWELAHPIEDKAEAVIDDKIT